MSQPSTDLHRLVRLLPNALSLLRVGLTCVFAVLLRELFTSNTGLIPTLILFGAICLTDLLDGILARRLGATTRLGAWLDLYTDFFYIILSLVVFNSLGLVPVWFTLIVCGKFIEFLLTSRFFRGCGKVKTPFFADFLGRGAASMYYFLPGSICVLYQISRIDQQRIVSVLIYFISAISLLSILIRCANCIQAKKSMPALPREP